MTRPSIAELQRETSRWPTDWKPALDEEGAWDGDWTCTNDDGLEDRVSADTGEDYANELAKYVARLANSAPVLLEIAAAALAWQTSPQAKARQARAQLLAALGKVAP